MKPIAFCVVMCLFTQNQAFPQQPVDPHNMHERIIAVVELVGAGTYADPKRPLFAPDSKDLHNPDGIHSYRWEASDDGRFAIVEFVARNRAALLPILNDPRVVRVFEKGRVKKSDNIEAVIRTFKRDSKLFEGAFAGSRP